MNRIHRIEEIRSRPGCLSRIRSSLVNHSPFKMVNAPKASSLITTLLVLVVLSTIVVAFMQSMSVERSVARSTKNAYQAQLAAEAGVSDAESLLQKLFQKYPDSITAWQSVSTNSVGITQPTEGTFFHFRADTNLSVGSSSFPDARGPADPNPNVSPATQVRLCAIPLISGARWTESTNLSSAFPNGINSTNSVDFNRNSEIGISPTTGKPAALRGLWVEVLQNASLPKQTNIGAANYNPPISRYAFWVEDNSFRVNINTSGASDRGAFSLGTNTSEISLGGAFQAISGNQSQSMANGVVALRQTASGGRLRDSQLNYSPSATSNFYNDVKFIVTENSAGLNLSRGGVQRVNLNEIIYSTSNATDILAQLNRLEAVITNSNAAPNFGQRFYRNSASSPALNASDVSADHASIYLDKIAANIRDYYDLDSQPTIVNSDRSVRIGSKPQVATGFSVSGSGTASGPNDVRAIGKEIVPCLQEAAMRFRLISLVPVIPASDKLANYNFELDYYFCFWNPYTKDIKISNLGANPFLKIYNQFGFDTGGASPNIPSGRPYQISLSSFVDGSGKQLVFRANEFTILTTDPNPNDILCRGKSAEAFRPTASAIGALLPQQRVFIGQTARVSGGKYRVATTGTVGEGDSRAGTAFTDYDTHMLIGNDDGILECFTAIPMPVQLALHNDAGEIASPNSNFYRGGSLSGNMPSGNFTPGASGDPRSVNEQIAIQRYSKAFASDNTRFLDSGLGGSGGGGNNPAYSSFGLFNTKYVNPTDWPDFSTTGTGINNAPFVVANTNAISVGSLGNVYDPARRMTRIGNIEYSKGGGRTFRVGQSDLYDASSNSFALWDGVQTNASRTWASWRLCDIFSVRANATKTEGVINPNGAQKDGGAALRAALQGFTYISSPDGAPTTSGKVLTKSQVDALISAFVARLQGGNINTPNDDSLFWERGEISELGIFRSGSLLGIDMGGTLDRGREEIFNRLVEMISTKGCVFTVHSIGQALKLDKNGNSMPISTAKCKAVFEILPIFDSPLPSDASFDPSAQGNSVANRFRKPDRYQLRTVSKINE